MRCQKNSPSGAGQNRGRFCYRSALLDVSRFALLSTFSASTDSRLSIAAAAEGDVPGQLPVCSKKKKQLQVAEWSEGTR